MTKKAYDVNEVNVGPTKDGSFRSCLCTLLIFFSICVIIVVLTMPWRNSTGNGQSPTGNKAGTAYEQTGSKYKPSKKDNDENETEKESEKPRQENKPSKPLQKETTTIETNEQTTTEKPTKLLNSDKEPVEKQKEFEKIKEFPTTTPKDETKDTQNRIKDDRLKELVINNTENPVTSSNLSTSKPIIDNSTEKSLKPQTERPTTTTSITNTTNLSNSHKNNTNTTDSHLIKNNNDASEDFTTQVYSGITEKTVTDKGKDKLFEKEKEVITISPNEETTTILTNDNEETNLKKNKIKEKNNTPVVLKAKDEITEEVTTVNPNEETTTILTVEESKLKKNEAAEGVINSVVAKKKDEIEEKDITTMNINEETTTVINDIKETKLEDNKLIGKRIIIPGVGEEDKTTEKEQEATTINPNEETTTVLINNIEETKLENNKIKDRIIRPGVREEDKTTEKEQEVTTVSSNEETTTILTVEESNLKKKETFERIIEDKTKQVTTEKNEEVTTLNTNDKDVTTITSGLKKDLTEKIEHHEETTQTPEIETTTIEEETTTNGNNDETTTIILQLEKDLDKSKKNINNQLIENKTMVIQHPTESTTQIPEITSTESLPKQKPLDIMETDEPISRITTPPKNHEKDIQENNQEKREEKDLCDAECKKSGARILSKINYFTDPCEQFYDYACGGDNGNNNPPDNWRRIAGELDKIHGKSPQVYRIFQKYYDSCVDYHGEYDIDKRIIDAKYILSLVGQPYKDDGVDGASSLTDLLTKLLLLDSSPLFDISVDVDKESHHFIFQLNVGKRFSHLSEDNSLLLTKKKCIKKSTKHFDFSVSFFNSINLNEMHQVYSNCLQNTTGYIDALDKAIDILGVYDDLESSIEHVEEILKKYMKLPNAANIRKDIITKKFTVRKVSELMFHYPLINWKKILETLTGKEIHAEDLVQVYFSDFFFVMFSNQQTLTKPELYNAILAMFIHDLYSNLVLPTPMSNPEEFCLQQSSNLMKEVASSLYLNSINIKEVEGDLQRLEELFTNMKSELENFISHADWTIGPRSSLLRKLNTMELDTWNRSTVWKNNSLLEERMKNVLNKNYANYSEFFVALTKRNREILYNIWDTMAYTKENIWWFFLTPYSTSPVSIYGLNRIAFPPSLLLTHSKNLPKYLSLAKLGFNLAKAIGYHFDTTGSKYIVIWDKKSKDTYEASRVCMADSYKSPIQLENDGKILQFTVSNDSLNLSFNERFVEDMALNLTSLLSYEVLNDYPISWVSNPFLKETFSNKKMFFIALAQEHCEKLNLEDFFLRLFENEHLPPSLMLDTSLSHSEMFTETFGCREGARINAMFKCKPFPEMQETDYEDTEY